MLSLNIILALLLFSFRLKCHTTREASLNYTIKESWDLYSQSHHSLPPYPALFILILQPYNHTYSLFPVFHHQFNISSIIAGYCLLDLFIILSPLTQKQCPDHSMFLIILTEDAISLNFLSYKMGNNTWLLWMLNTFMYVKHLSHIRSW